MHRGNEPATIDTAEMATPGDIPTPFFHGNQDFQGFLFSKLAHIGSRSEGPAYYLQQLDYSEVPIEKHSQLWEEDPNLQHYLGRTVEIWGHKDGDRLTYTEIGPREREPGEIATPAP